MKRVPYEEKTAKWAIACGFIQPRTAAYWKKVGTMPGLYADTSSVESLADRLNREQLYAYRAAPHESLENEDYILSRIREETDDPRKIEEIYDRFRAFAIFTPMHKETSAETVRHKIRTWFGYKPNVQ